MRTTLTVDTDIVEKLKEIARLRRKTFKSVVKRNPASRARASTRPVSKGPRILGGTVELWVSSRCGYREAYPICGSAGNLTTDAVLAIEHQAELRSNDVDFGRFRGLRWKNPL